jgi:hypothetical protein
MAIRLNAISLCHRPGDVSNRRLSMFDLDVSALNVTTQSLALKVMANLIRRYVNEILLSACSGKVDTGFPKKHAPLKEK